MGDDEDGSQGHVTHQRRDPPRVGGFADLRSEWVGHMVEL